MTDQEKSEERAKELIELAAQVEAKAAELQEKYNLVQEKSNDSLANTVQNSKSLSALVSDIGSIKGQITAIELESGELKTSNSELSEKNATLQARIDQIERDQLRDDVGTGDEAKSWQHQLTDSDVFEQYKAKGFIGASSKIKIETKGEKGATFGPYGPAAGVLSPSLNIGRMTGGRGPRLRLRDIIPSSTTTNGSIEYPQEGKILDMYQVLAVPTSIGDVMTVPFARQYVEGSKVTIGTGVSAQTFVIGSIAINGGATDDPSDPTYDATGVLTLVDDDGAAAILTVHPVGSQVLADDFNFTPECNLKPCLKIDAVPVEAKAMTCAAWVEICEQTYEDSEALRNHISSRLPMKVNKAEEKVILYGADGFFNANIPTIGTLPAATTEIDQICYMMTVALLADEEVEYILMNPLDIQTLKITKDAAGAYVGASEFAIYVDNGQLYVWGVPVIPMNSLKKGDVLAGNFSLGSQIWDRKTMTIQMTNSHNDNFTKNILTIRAEKRLLHTIWNLSSFVKHQLVAP